MCCEAAIRPLNGRVIAGPTRSLAIALENYGAGSAERALLAKHSADIAIGRGDNSLPGRIRYAPVARVTMCRDPDDIPDRPAELRDPFVPVRRGTGRRWNVGRVGLEPEGHPRKELERRTNRSIAAERAEDARSCSIVPCCSRVSRVKRQAEGSLSYITEQPGSLCYDAKRALCVRVVSLLLPVLITSIYYRSEDLTPIRAG